MGFLSQQQQPSKKVNNIPVTQSSQGYPIPVVMGQNKTHTSLLLISPFTEQSIGSGGKGLGGGKSAAQYNYFADVQAALCNGPVVSIASVWTGQTWLQTGVQGDPVTITQNYSPQLAAILLSDTGVGFANTYSNTYSDYGQPASTVLSGSDYAPLKYVPWFVSGTAYAVGNQVFNGTDVYTCLVANTGVALSNGTYWHNTGAGLTTGQYSISFGSLGTLTLSSVANASAGSTVYTGSSLSLSGISGASNAFAGYYFIVAGYTHAQNNGTFLCTASTSSTITLNNPNGIAETHAATAQDQGNVYHFSTADAGKTAIVNYMYNLAFIEATNVFIVPDGPGAPGFPNYSVVLSQQYSPTQVSKVQYYGEDNPNAGVSLSQVSGTPTQAGTYQAFTNSTLNAGPNSTYKTYIVFSSADIGQEILVTWGYVNESAVGSGNGAGPAQLLNFTLYGGNMGQPINSSIESGGTFSVVEGSSGFSISVSGAPGETLGYSGIAHVDYLPMYFGTSGEMQDNTFEVITPDGYGGGITDCNPVQCITRVLTDTRWGLGGQFPVAAIDNTTNGSWGGASGTPGARQLGSTAWNWFAANNFFISPKMDSQDSAASVMAKWLEAGMCAAYFSEGLLKLVPYGSTSTAANGCTWEAPQNFVVALDDSCFLDKGEGEDRIKIERSAWQDAYNKVQVDFDNRQNQYFDDITQEWDQAAINRFGERDEDPQTWDFIHALNAAAFAASMRVKRLTSIRNTYTFSLPYAYAYLEPMDIVTITTSSIWAAGTNNTNLGITNLPVRITKIVDDPNDGLEITCEDYQALALEPVLYNKGISQGASVNMFAQPGNTEAILFEATSRLTNYQGNQVWIGACGASSQWGGCNVYVSQDGDTYLSVGTIESTARIGTLVSEFNNGNVVNPGFENGLTGWTSSYSTLSLDTSTPQAGTASLVVASSLQYGAAVSTYKYKILPGQTVTVSGYVKSDGTAVPNIQLEFLDSSNAYLSGVQASASPGNITSWTYVTATGTAPNGTVSGIWSLQNNNATGAGVCEFDSITVSGVGVDPDTSNTLVVQLEQSCPALDSGTTTDADYGNTLCFVDGEIIAYSACTATGTDQYTMDDYIRRGQYGSQILPHIAGSAFMRLDSTVFKYRYDPQWAGQTIYFKFQSFNKWGNAAQTLSTVEPVAFIVPGLGPGSVDAASGIIVAQSSFNIGAGPFGGTPAAVS